MPNPSLVCRHSFFAAIFLFCPAAATFGQTLEFSDELFVIVASASPDTTFIGGQGNATVTIDQQSGDFGGPGISHGLLEFRDFLLPDVADVLSARINFHTTSATNGPVNVYRMTESWDETTTWNSLVDGIVPGLDTANEPSDSIEDIEEGPLSFDVTQIIQDWQDGQPQYGFGLFNTSGDGWDVQTADDFVLERFAPTLSVEVRIPPPTKLQIDPATGLAQIVSISEGFDFDLRAYLIDSEDGKLTPEFWSDGNLNAQGLGDSPDFGKHWDVVNDSTEQLYEAFFLGGTAMEPQDVLQIGKIIAPFDPLTETPDLQFEVGTSDFVTGSANTIALGGLPVEFTSLGFGDYNNDGFVDGADFTVWRDSRGEQGEGLAADGNGDGVIDDQDLSIWRSTFGLAAASSTATVQAVPEPSGFLLLLAGLFSLQFRARRCGGNV